MPQHGRKYFTRRPLPPLQTLGTGSVGQNSTFTELVYIACQIKENDEYSNMVANILPAYPAPPFRMGSFSQNSTFSEHGNVAY